MKKVVDALKQWLKDYLQHRNLILKNLQGMVEHDDSLTVKFADREVQFLIRPMVDDFYDLLKGTEGHKNVTVVVLNNRQNLDSLLKVWPRLVEHKSFSVYFVNPLSTTDKKWVICPYTHSKICDDGSLKLGLGSMFEMVEPVCLKEMMTAEAKP